ncbi:MAG: coenzyme F420-0:L-glutamate ligase [Candidatus Gracilibacteria bacterium]|jgi:coenzyme F420-0:L-glutamate ligase
MNKLEIEAVKSKIITPKDDLLEVIIKSLRKSKSKLNQGRLCNGDILVISSKVVAVTQGQVVKINNPQEFDRLVASEADQIISSTRSPQTSIHAAYANKSSANSSPGREFFQQAIIDEVPLTLKNGILIPWAGIDRSNTEKGFAVLWPKDSFKVAAQLQKELKKIYKLKKLGIIISDSTCRPLRRGVSGIALGYAGFKGVNDLRGHKDLYNNKLKVTQQAVADNLATAAHLVMGEADECTPFTIISNAPVTFTDAKINPKDLLIDPKDCLFSPLYGSLL